MAMFTIAQLEEDILDLYFLVTFLETMISCIKEIVIHDEINIQCSALMYG